ncbi:MAG: ATP-binding protein, partial [Anaerolineae bacterium]
GQVILANPVAEGDLSVLAGARVGDMLTHLGDRPLAELLTSHPEGLWHEVATDDRIFELIARPVETGSTPGEPPPATKMKVAETVSGAATAAGEIQNRAGWVLVIRDVTREREIQRHAQPRERLATVGQLAAGIAHDFNNIMATIVLYAQMLSQTEDLTPRGHERLATVNQQAMYATNLTQQILDFSRRAVLERRPLNLLPLLKEQLKLLERTLPENIKIALAYGPDEYTVNADPTRVQQAMMNLALNARDAMPTGGDLRFGLERIQIQPGESPPLPEMEAGEWVQVTVADTGSGIPPDVLPRVFDPFFTTKEPGKGSGLGLAQVHGIVKQHDGEIDVQSQVGQGTTLTIYLPALPVHPAEAPTLEMEALTRGEGETILVVEDNAPTRQALVESLELLNYRMLEAADGREALEILERQTSEVSSPEVALVLSDVVMPGMGGVALFHALRQRGLAVKVVLMTGHPLEEEMERLRTQGLSDWLPKPPSLEQLAEVVARALSPDPCP